MLAVTEFDPNTILVALIGLLGIWLTARNTRKKVEQVHAEVRTNHGKRQGERIEEMGDAIVTISAAQKRMVAEVTEMKVDQGLQRGMVEALGASLMRHNAEDERRFAAVQAGIAEVRANQDEIKVRGERMTRVVAAELDELRRAAGGDDVGQNAL